MARLTGIPEATFEALAHIRDTALVRFDSLFSPERSLWTLTYLNKLHELFVERFDDGEGAFLDKLRQQLDGSDDDVLQLSAEILYVQQFFTSGTKEGKKVENVQNVLGWARRKVAVPEWAIGGLSYGLAGDQTFNRHRPNHMAWLIVFLIKWHSFDSETRRTLLDSPWQFRDLVLSTEFTQAYQPMREAWLYMIFPDTFENISSRGVKARIQEALTEKLKLPSSANVDEDLLKIRRALTPQAGEGFHFYKKPIVDLWREKGDDLPPSVTRQQVIDAMQRFDMEQRVQPEWVGWEENGNYKFGVEHEDKVYPPKEIISLATGVKKNSFSGGNQSNRYLIDRGFTVRPLRGNVSLRSALRGILGEYLGARSSGSMSKDHPVVAYFKSAEQALEVLPSISKRPHFEVSYSVGKGNWATVPWIAILDDRETETTQHGRYVVFLFRSDCTGVYLTLNQGVTKPIRELGRSAGIQKLREEAAAMRSRVETLARVGFSLDDKIELGPDGLGKDYEASTVAHKFYPCDALPSDEELANDMEAVLNAYDLVLGNVDEDDDNGRATRAWIFQGSPKTFNGSAAVRELPELKWSADQYADEIRVGDRVYVWESGPAAGVIAIAEVVSPATVGPDDDRSRPYWIRPAEAKSQAPRVRLRIMRVLDERLTRQRLQDDPRFSDLTFLKAPMGTNFPVSEVHRLALDDLIGAEPFLHPSTLCASFTVALSDAGLSFGQDHESLVRRFFASVLTKPFVILTGLSGSGKTQLALKFGEWLGQGRYSVVPVRPDWTGPEPLLGYEDALLPAIGDRRAWHVPEPLKLMLRASRDPKRPYALILDELNLAHVERYFADVLSGAESREDVLPNLELGTDAYWRIPTGMPSKTPIPRNLIIIGTVNIDETTYMFSPKVLDRANTIEFRVSTGSLPTDLASLVRPDRCKPALDTELRSLLRVATDDSWQVVNAPPILDTFAAMTRDVHQGLSTHSLEFGHRTYYESIRLAAILHACGLTEADSILDVFLLQKVLPRLHGSRRKLEPVVRMLGAFAYEKCSLSDTKPFDVVPPQAGRAAALPLTYSKLTRMMKALRDNQFASFHD